MKNQNVKKLSYWAGVITLGLVVGISLQMVRANWTQPTTQAPNGNIGAPINTGSGTQVKNGALGVTGIFSAPQICLGTGPGACRTNWPSGTTSTTTGPTSGQLYGTCSRTTSATYCTICSNGYGGSATYTSPFTGGCTCPAGYSAVVTGSYTSPNNSIGCCGYTRTVYSCRYN